jgi:hypothetical protein
MKGKLNYTLIAALLFMVLLIILVCSWVGKLLTRTKQTVIVPITQDNDKPEIETIDFVEETEEVV